MRFINWDNRPALLGPSGAVALLEPGASWVPVDTWDVWATGSVLSEAAWRDRFSDFGPLDPPMTTDLLHSPSPKRPNKAAP